MENYDPKAVIGTNAWPLAGGLEELKEAADEAVQSGFFIFDTAKEYALGGNQRLLGRICPENARISIKLTPVNVWYREGQIRSSLMKDLKNLNREHVDFCFLHLSNSMEENLLEMAELYREGLIGNIGVAAFNLAECKVAKLILEEAGIPLYGVQNHFSLLDRRWEKNGLLEWCKENQIAFWSYAVLEEGLLCGNVEEKKEKLLSLERLSSGKTRRLSRLIYMLERIGERHGLNAAQTAIAYTAGKGIVPICTVKSRRRAKELACAVSVSLGKKETACLEMLADEVDVKLSHLLKG